MRLFTQLSPVWKGEIFRLESPGLEKGRVLLALPATAAAPGPAYAQLPPELFLNSLPGGPLSAGTSLLLEGRRVLAVLSRGYLEQEGDAHSQPCLRLRALETLPKGPLDLTPSRGGPALAWVTVSDKGCLGQRQDESGPAMLELCAAALPLRCATGFVVPDEIHRLRSLVLDLALTQGYDLILTSGGTGLTPRDITPEALLPLIEKRISGLEQAMLAKSLSVTPRGALSRPVCGSVGQSLVLTLPGSARAVRENLEAVLPALGHGLEKLQGSTADCGRR